LKIYLATELCFWTEQRLNGTELLGFELAKTLEVLNTILVGNSQLSDFPLNGYKWLVIYELRLSELDWFAVSEILVRLDLSAQVRILAKFCHELPRNFEYQSCC
jgi:hypothetical protein